MLTPISDVASEPYFAGFQLFEGDEERLGVGNALEAWGLLGLQYVGDWIIKQSRRRIQLELGTSRTGASGPVLALRRRAPRRRAVPLSSKFNTFPVATTLCRTVWLDPNLEDAAQRTKTNPKTSPRSSRPEPHSIKSGCATIQAPATITTMMATAGFSATWRWRLHSTTSVVVRFWQTWWFIMLNLNEPAGWGNWVRPCASLKKKKISVPIAARLNRPSALETGAMRASPRICTTISVPH